MANKILKKWVGEPPSHCDICNAPIMHGFVDGRVQGGSWANMCPLCHMQHGVGLGTGKGQHYERLGKQWLKVGG